MEITWVTMVGFVAFVTNVWSNHLLARLKTGGWAVRLVTNVLWIVYSWHTWGGWPLMLNHLVFVYINIDGWISWRRAQRAGTSLS